MKSKPIQLKADEIFVGYTIVLYPTEEQKQYLNRCIQLYRFVYNWTLDQKAKRLSENRSGEAATALITDKELSHKLSDLRNENEWLQDVPLHTLRNAMYDAIDSYERYFCKKAKRPKYKSKKHSKQSFSPRTEDFALYFSNDSVHIEGLKSKISIKINTNLKKSDHYKVYNARITYCKDGQYRLSYTTIKKNTYVVSGSKMNKAIGIDLNVRNLIVTSYNGGEIFKAPDVNSINKSIARLQRKCRKDSIRANQERNNLENISEKSKNAIKRQIKLAKKV